MIKLVCFDLDGVLVESKDTHYTALNLALSEIDEKYNISNDEHIKKYDGLPTNNKLELLTKEKGLPKSFHQQIWKRKQELTFEVIKNKVKPNEDIINLFKKLKSDNIIIFITSNSIKQTTKMYLLNLGLFEYVDEFISNEDVKISKPHPAMYLKAMVMTNVTPKETLIVEDSPVGIKSAIESGANLLVVKNPSEVYIKNIYNKINDINNISNDNILKGKKMNILIPMAGAGSRFVIAGYTFPKPLIEIRGKPMIQVVVENLGIEATYTYVVRKEHLEKYNLKSMLNVITPNCNVISVNELTEGAACTTLLAKEYINKDEPLLIANSDQFIEWNPIEFIYKMSASGCDGGILTFKNTHPKWSYVILNEFGDVTELAEKKVISNNATVGIYYYNSGKEYVKYAEQMIQKNLKINNEFYVAPVYNEYLLDNKKIKTYDINKMWGIGTPEDLNYFLENYTGNI